MTTYLGATGARELIGWLSGGADVLELGDQSRRVLSLRRPGSDRAAADPPDRHVVQRHVLDYAPYAWTEARPPVPLLPDGVVLLSNSPALLGGLPVPPDATVLVAGEHGISAGADGPLLTAEELSGLVGRGGSGHVRVLADGSHPDLAGATWSSALRALLHLHEATFLAVRACASRLDARGSVLAAVLDGVAGDVPKPFTGLFTGLVKSLALEYPRTAIAASLHERAERASALQVAAAELSARHLLPVVLHTGGRRLTLRAVAEPAVSAEAPALPSDALVVAAGGARGIGAAVLAGLARACRPRLVVLGSSVLDAWTEEELATSPADRAAFIRRLVTGPERTTAKEANARFDRIQQARTATGNLAELRRICGADRVRYLPCDLRDPDAVLAALADLSGPPDLLLLVAGTNRAAEITTKSRHDFLTVRDVKVHSYLNLKAALAGRPARRWCNFGSFVGFTGQRGETDYASANDFLTCAATAGGDGEFTVGWTLWRDTGLGASPIMRARLDKAGQYTAIPTGEGVTHFLAELADPRGRRATVFFGARERAAIDAAVPDYLPFSTRPSSAGPVPEGPASRPLPFVDRIRPGDGELTAERVFDLDRDGYLAMHQVHGYPTLPGTFVPELAAEAALALVPGRVPVVFEDLRLESFLRIYRPDRPQAKRIQARLLPAYGADEAESVVAVRVLGDLVAPNGTVLAADRLHFSVTVRMRDAPVPAPRWTHWDDDGAEPLTDPYHAPGSPIMLREVFRSTRDTRLHPLGRRAALDLDAAAVRRWFPDLVVPCVLLDGLVRVAVLDRHEGRWTPVAIPRYVRRIDLYQSHTDASLAAAGEAVELYVTPVDIDLEARHPDNRALAVRRGGEVIMQVKDMIGAIVGYLDQPTGRFVDRSSFDRGVR